MGVVTFLSAKGSPGTTTAALLTAALWPAPVLLLDADTAGGDVALRLRRADGSAVDRDRGLLSLLPLARREVPPSALVEHAQQLRGGLEVVAGLTGPGQAGAAGHLWDNLAEAVARTTDRDVVVDAGRVTPQAVHLPLLQRSDLLVCVLRPDVPGVVHARERLLALAPHLTGPDGRGPRVAALLVADRPGSRDVEGAAGLLARDLPDVTLLGTLAHDPSGAEVFAGFEVPRPERTLLVRSARPVVAALLEAVRRERGEEAVEAAEQAPESVAKGRRAAPRRRVFARARA